VVACLAQVLPNADEIAAGNDSAEIVHQLRVGIRRLRTALRELAALGRTFDPAWGPALVDVFRALGDQRDRELLLTKMQPRLVRAGAPEIDVPTEDAPDSSVSEVVRAPAFQSTLVALTGFTAGTIQQPADAHEQDAGATRRLLRKRLARLLRDIRRDAERFQTLAPASQHRVRKRLKRLRYLAEFVAPLFDTRKAKRFIEALEPAQDALGGYNDEIVALEAYRALARSDPKAWFAVGWLTALQDEHVRDAARALGGLRDAPRFWKK
jgi:CHAD domain-containing protein